MNQSSTKQTNNMKTANNPTCVLTYTRARAHARTPLRTFACAWALFLAIVIGAGNVAWGQNPKVLRSTTEAQQITATGKYIAPPGYRINQIECWGGGGSGQKNSSSGGRGGGGGGYAGVFSLNLAVDAVINVTSLGGGGESVATNGDGNPGEKAEVQFGTNFGKYVRATGGASGGSGGVYGNGSYSTGLSGRSNRGGTGSTAADAYHSGGGGGGAGNGNNSYGSDGGSATSGMFGHRGSGGSGGSEYGGNGGGGQGTANDVEPGQSRGGGGGGSGSQSSGAGADGGVWVTLVISSTPVSYHAPTGYYISEIQCWGGGAGGNAGPSGSNGGGGGGGGGYARVKPTNIPSGENGTVSISVGAGGAGGTAGNLGKPGSNSFVKYVYVSNGSTITDSVSAHGGKVHSTTKAYGGDGGAYSSQHWSVVDGRTGGKGGDATYTSGGRIRGSNCGAGGGSGADSLHNGNNGSNTSGSNSYGGGGVAVGNHGGAGGAGGRNDYNSYWGYDYRPGFKGNSYGGGGGGGYNGYRGGDGGNGGVIITTSPITVHVKLYLNAPQGSDASTTLDLTTYDRKYDQTAFKSSDYLACTSFSCTGWKFAGWYTVNGTEIDEDDIFKVNDLITEGELSTGPHEITKEYYAHWERRDVDVTFIPNDPRNSNTEGATLSGTTPQTIKYGSLYSTLPNSFPTATLTGYTRHSNSNAVEWYAMPDLTNAASDITITSSSTCNQEITFPTISESNCATAKGAITLYSKWDPNTYTVNFNPNTPNDPSLTHSAKVKIGSIDYNENETVGVSIKFDSKYDEIFASEAPYTPYNAFPSAECEGYVFRGWYTTTTSGDLGHVITKDSTYKYAITPGITLKAKWEKKISATVTVERVKCFGGSDGKITVSGISGGDGTKKVKLYKSSTQIGDTKTYSSSNIEFTGLSYGTDYKVVVYDTKEETGQQHGESGECSFWKDPITVDQPPLLKYMSNTPEVQTAVTCQTFGEIKVQWEGGNGQYTLKWSGMYGGVINQVDISTTSYIINNLDPDFYTITLIDQNGCKTDPESKQIALNKTSQTISISNYTASEACLGSMFHTSPSKSGNTIPEGTRYTWTTPTKTGVDGNFSAEDLQQDIHGVPLTATGTNPNVVFTVTPWLGTCHGNPFQVTVPVGTDTCSDVNISVDDIPSQCAGNTVKLVAHFAIEGDNPGEYTYPEDNTYSVAWLWPGDSSTVHANNLINGKDSANFAIPSSSCVTNYLYTIIFTDADGKQKSYVGTINVNGGEWWKQLKDSTATQPVACVSALAEIDRDSVMKIAPVITDSCGKSLTRTFWDSTTVPNPIVCAGQVIYTVHYEEECTHTTHDWKYTVNVENETKGPEFFKDKMLTEVPAKKNENEGCVFRVPDIVSQLDATMLKDNCTPFADLTKTQDLPIDMLLTEDRDVKIVVTDKCGNSNDTTVRVIVPKRPSITTKPAKWADSAIRCNSGTTSLTVQIAHVAENTTYAWTKNGAPFTVNSTNSTMSAIQEGNITIQLKDCGAGTYKLTVTDSNSCAVEDSVTIGQPNPVQVTVDAIPTQVCPGESTVLSVSATGGVPSYTYKWNDETEATTSSVRVTPQEVKTYNYKVTVTDHNNCSEEGTISIMVYDTLVPTITGLKNICVNASLDDNMLNLTASATGATSYQWTLQSGEDGMITGNSNQQAFSASWSTQGEKHIHLEVTNAQNCVSHIVNKVTVNSLPVYTFKANKGWVCKDGEDTLAVINYAANTLKFKWSHDATLTKDSAFVTPTTSTLYTVTVTHKTTGCSSSDSRDVEVLDPQVTVTNISGDTTICSGASTFLHVFANSIADTLTYQWYKDSEEIANCTGDTLKNITESGSYKVVATAIIWDEDKNVMCESTDEMGVKVKVLEPKVKTPVIESDDDDLNICIGESTTLTASVGDEGIAGNVTYMWEPINVIGPEVNVTPNETTPYTVTATATVSQDGKTCTVDSVNTVTLTVIPTPTVAITVSRSSICQGQQSVLEATSGYSKYQWNNSKTTATIEVSVAGTYTVTVTDAYGCSMASSQEITVNSLPQVTMLNTTVCPGQGTATLSVVGQSQAAGALQYAWKNTDDETVGTEATLTVNAPNAETSYTVTVTDGNGCENTGTGTISVYTPVPVAVNNAELCADGSATLTATFQETQNSPLYSWEPSTYLSAATGASVTFSGAAASTTPYQVTVTGTDDNGCTTTATSSVTVNPLPAVTITPVSQLCPSAGSTTVEAEVTTTTTESYTFNWSAGTGLTLSNQTDDGATSQVTASFGTDCNKTYTVNLDIEDANHCTATATPITITVKDDAAPVIGTIANITATAAGNCKYEMPNLSATVLAATQDNVCGYEGNAVSFVSQSVPEGTEYTQTNTQQPITVNVVVKDACGNTSNKDVTVMIPANSFTATITASDAVCYNGSKTIAVTPSNAYNNDVHYQWSNTNDDVASQSLENLTETTTYMVTATDGNGCTVNLNTTVTVNALPVVTVSNATVCNGQGTAVLEATVTGAEPFTYVWKDASQNTVTDDDGNGATLTLTDPVIEQNYTVTVTDNNGCVNSGMGHLKLDTIPQIVITTENLTVCAGSNLQLTAAKGETYVWDAPEGVTLSATTGASVNFSAAPTAQTLYTVTVTGTDGNGCHKTAYATVTVNPLPEVEITSDDLSICQGQQPTTLTATGGYSEYKWNNSAEVQEITVTTAGTYTVTVTDANVCKNSASATVTANPIPTVSLAVDDASLCPGQQYANFTVDANGGTVATAGAYTYTWYLGTGDITPTPTDTSAHTTSEIGTYKVKITDDEGCYAESNVITVSNHTLPNVTVNDANICASGTATLMANGAQTYTWNPATYLTVNNANATFSGATAGTYTVTVTGTDGNGCYKTATATVKVNPDVVLKLAEGSGTKDQNVCAGTALADIVFTVENATLSMTGNLPQGVTFSATDKKISGAPTQTGTFEYTIKATSNQTNPVCDPVTITGTIKVNPTVQLTVTPISQEICAGDTIQHITLTSVNGTLPTTMTLAEGLTYTHASDNAATITGRIAMANEYIYNIVSESDQSNPSCASIGQAVAITVHPNPVAEIAAIPTVCPANGTQSITANITTPTTANYTYAWTGGVVLTPATTANVNATSNTVSAAVPVVCDNSYTINLKVTDHYGCQATTSATMVVKDESTPTIATVTAVAANNNKVTATSIGNCKYTVPNLTTDAYVTVDDGCTTQPLQVTQNIDAGTQFTDSETSKVVTVTVTDGCGKTATVNITVQKPEAVTVSIEAGAEGVCKGSSTTLEATATSGNGDITYTWEPSTSLSAANTAHVTATPQTTTEYTVTARDGVGCSATATKTVNVYTLPTVQIADVTDLCPNAGSTSLTATAALNGATNPTFSYVWSVDNTALTITGNGATATLSNIPVTCDATTYTVSVEVTELSHNCKATNTNTVTVKDEENPTITANPTTIQALTAGGTGCTYTMPDLTLPANITYTVSDDNNCTSSDALLATLSPSVDAGTIISETTPVTMTITDGCGHTASTTIVVTVPDAFTIAENMLGHKDVKCPGGHDGEAMIDIDHIVGGTAPFTYTVDAGEYGTGHLFTGLSAGTHHLTAKDANGCTATKDVVITEPDPFQVTVTPVQATCANNDGSVTVTVTGGTPSDLTGYTFKYNGLLEYGEPDYSNGNGVASFSPHVLNNLKVGAYTVTIIDHAGCSPTAQPFTIGLDNNLVITEIPQPAPICSGGSFATQPVTTTPGTTYYTWDAPEQNPANGVDHATGSNSTTKYTVTGSNLENVTSNQVPVTLTYHVTAHNGVCTYESQLVMTVTATVRPQVAITPQNYTVCPNAGTQELSAQIAHVYAEKDTLTWTFNNGTPYEMTHTNPSSNYTENYTVAVPSNDCDHVYPYIVTYKDGVCTNSAEGSVTVTVADGIVMTPSTSADTTVKCYADIVLPHTVASKMPTHIEDACHQVIGDYTSMSVNPSVAPSCNGDVVFTYTYTDCKGNTKDYTYTYHIVTPALSLPPYGAQTVVCENDAVTPAQPEALSDGCSSHSWVSAVLVESTAEHPNPEHNVTNGSGTVTYHYTYTTCDGTVKDWYYVYTVAPADFTAFANVAVTRNCKNEFATVVPFPDTTICGVHIDSVRRDGYPMDGFNGECGTRTYKYDYVVNGQPYEWTYTETVEPEDFTMPENSGEAVACYSDIHTPTLPTVTDACDNELTPTGPVINPPQEQWTKCKDTVTYTYTYKDCQNHEHEWVYTYRVNDSVSPTFTTLPAENTVAADHTSDANGCYYSFPDLTDGTVVIATVNCSGVNGTIIYSQDTTGAITQTDVIQNLPVVVTATNGCGVSATTTVYVTVPALLTVAEDPDLTKHHNVTCYSAPWDAYFSPVSRDADGSITVAASGGTTTYQYTIDDDNYVYSDGLTFQYNGIFGNLSVPSPSETSYDASMGGSVVYGTYTFTVTDAHGCKASVPVKLYSPVQLAWDNCPQPITVCCDMGQTFATVVPAEPTLNTTANYSYEMSGGLHNNNQYETDHSPYVITYSTYDNCRYANVECSFSITVLPSATLAATDQSGDTSQTKCSGQPLDDIILDYSHGTATITGNLPASFITQEGNTIKISGTPTVTEKEVYNYAVTVVSQLINGVPCNTEEITGTITVEPAPSISLNATQESCAGNNATITATAIGIQPIYGMNICQYAINGNGYSEESNEFDYVKTYLDRNAGTYIVSVKDPTTQCSAIDTIEVTLDSPYPAQNISDTTANAICSGATFVMKPAAPTHGTFTTTYQWEVPSVTDITGGEAATTKQDSVSGTLNNATGVTQNAVYMVTPTTGSVCEGASFKVTVPVYGQLTLSENSVDATYCKGGENVDALSVTAHAGSGSYSYQWSVSKDGGEYTNVGENSNTYTPSTAENGVFIYRVTVHDQAGCGDSIRTIATITVNDTLEPNIVTNNDVCVESSLIKNALDITDQSGNATDYTYAWTLGDGGSITSTPTSSNAITAVWTSAGEKTISLEATNIATGCKSHAKKTITVYDVSVPALNNENICIATSSSNNILTLTTDEGRTDYAWTVGANGTFTGSGNSIEAQWSSVGNKTITVTYTDEHGCRATTTKVVQVKDIPTPVLSNSVICVNNSTTNNTLTLNTTSGMTAYVWILGETDGTITAGQGTSSITANWTEAGSKTVTVAITNSDNCTASTSATVTVNALTVPELTGGEVCVNTSEANTTFNLSTQSGMSSYVWTVGENGTYAGTGNAIEAQWSSEGEKTVTVTFKDGNNCTATSNATVTVYPKPAAEVTAANSQCFNASDGFITLNLTSGTPDYTVVWYAVGVTTNGSENSLGNGTHTLTDLADGNYDITVIDSKGCKVSTSQVVNQIAQTLTVTAANGEWTYDGEAHDTAGYIIDFGDEHYLVTAEAADAGQALLNGDVVKATVTGSITDVGTQDNAVTSVTVMRGAADVTCYYDTNMVNGQLKVNRADVVVKADSLTKIYGENDPELTWTATGLQNGESESLLTVSVSRVAGENIGDYVITPTGDAVQGNYNVTYVPDTLTILKATATVTADAKTKVFGTSDPVLTATVTGMTNGDVPGIISYTLSRAAGETVGKYVITPTGSAVQGNYNVVYKTDTLTITPQHVTVSITGNTSMQAYTGETLSVSGFTAVADNSAYDIAHVSGTAVASGVGKANGDTTYNMELAVADFTNDDSNFDVTFVIASDGWLRIVPAGTVIVTINGHNQVLDYDTYEHTVTGYEVSIWTPDGSDPYTTSDFSYSGDSTATGTLVGTTHMNLAADQFTNMNTNFTNVMFHVTDGYLTINKANVEVVITGEQYVVEYTGQEQTVSGYTVNASNTHYNPATDMNFTGNSTATGTLAGIYTMGLNAGQFTNTNDNFNATFSVTDGWLEIVKAGIVIVNLSGNNGIYNFDGTEQTVNGYQLDSIAGQSETGTRYEEIYPYPAAVEYSGSATASQTTVGTSYMGLASGQFTNTNPNYIVRFNVKDGWVMVCDSLRMAVAPTDVVCHSQDNGTATFTVTGGKAYTDAAKTRYSYTVVSANNGTVASGTTGTNYFPNGMPYTSDSIYCAPVTGSTVTVNGLAPDTYTATFTDLLGNTVSRTFTIAQPDTLIVATLTVPTTASGLCPNQSTYPVSMTVTGGNGENTIAWSADAVNEGATTSNTASSTVVNKYGTNDCGHEYTVTVTVTDQKGCADSKTVKFTVVDDLNPDFTVPANITLCRNASGEIEAPTSVTGVPTNLTDNCTSLESDFTVEWVDLDTLPASNLGPRVIRRQWTVTDLCGKNTVKVQNITVNPKPVMDTPGNQVICHNGTTTNIAFSSDNTGGTVVYNWACTNTENIGGLIASGSNNIGELTLTNTTTTAQTSTITVTPTYTYNSVDCNGDPVTFTVTVNPQVQMNKPANDTICHGAEMAAVNFTTDITDGTMSYAWTRDNTANVTGIDDHGTGNIPATALSNLTATAQTVTFTVRPTYTNNGISCVGADSTFTVTVNPQIRMNTVADQKICHNTQMAAVLFASDITDGTIVYNWTRDKQSEVTGVAIGGQGDIAVATLSNLTATAQTVTFTVRPTYTNNGISCEGADSTFTVTVNPQVRMDKPANDTICHGAEMAAVNFTTAITDGSMSYAWTRDNTTNVTGIADHGTGNIPATALSNLTTTTQTVTFTVTPTYHNNGLDCEGADSTFTITVNPMIEATSISNQVVCNNGSTTAVTFGTNATGEGTVSYAWVNDNTAIGLGASGTTGSIASFTATNGTTAPIVGTITVTPTYTYEGNSCEGTPTTFTITVNPTAQVNAVANQVVCNNTATTAVTFATANTGGTTTYTWTNNTPGIGLAASGEGNIASFTAVNTGTESVMATITVTPHFNGSCDGPTKQFTITVNPQVVMNTPDNQTLCSDSNMAAVVFSTAITDGTMNYAWTRDNTTGITGLGASGTGNIDVTSLRNTTSTVQTTTFTVTPTYTNNGISCEGAPVTFTISVNPEVLLTATNATQTKTFGQDIDDIVVTYSSYADLTYTTLPNGLSYNNSTNTLSGKLTAVGDYTVTFTATSTQTPNCGYKEQVVNIHVNPAVLTIAINDSKVYDGILLTTNYNSTVITATGLQNGATLTAGVVKTPSANVNTYTDNTGANITTAFATSDGISNYTVSYNFKQEITPAAITIKAVDKTKVYDNNPSTDPELTASVTGLPANGVASVYSLSRIAGQNVGEYTISVNMTDGANPNYTVTTQTGTFKITPITNPVVVTITGHTGTAVYDASSHTVSGYETSVSNSLYTADMYTKPAQNAAAATAARTDVGTTTMTLSEADFSNTSANFTNVTFNVTPGTQTITRASVTVTADNKIMVVGETAPALTATVAGLQGSDNESLITYALSRQPGDTIGTYVITASGDAVQGNYNVTYYPGTFTIVEPTKIVTITSGSKNWTYDGTAHSWPEYTVTCEGASVTHIDGDATKFRMPTGDTLHITPTASVTHVGPAVANTFSYQFTPTTSIYTYETATNNGNLSINKKPLSVTGTFSKEYDGTPLTVSYSELNYNGGLVDGDVLTAGTITTDGFKAGTYHCGAGNTWSYATLEEGTATASGFAPTSVTQDYAVNFNLTLTITGRALALTAGSGEKVYDGTELANNSYDVTSTLGSGDAVSATVNGSQTCVGESANVIATASVQVMHDNGDGTFTDVTASYSPVNCTNGTLKVTPITTGFACPGDVTITLPEGVSQITITEADLNGPATLTPAVTGTHVGHNLISTTLGAGTHTVTWTLYDNCNNAMTTCDQTITVKYPECDGTMTYLGHTYAYKRIGSQCWFTENLRAEIGSDYHAYNDDPTMLDKFGYLYSWYTAVGVTEGDNDAVPDDHFVADDGTHYVQGICPAGWAVPSQADVEVLNLSGFDADMLKDPSTEYWLPGYEGTGESGFKARAGGRYNATQSRYEDLMTGFHFWQSEAPTGSVSLVSACIAYYCGSVLTATPNIKTDRKSVRCLRKVAP